MENKPTLELVRAWKELVDIEFQDLRYDQVQGSQIMAALLGEINMPFAKKFLYKVLQGAANEARRRALLINPTAAEGTYSRAVGNAQRMLPSKQGWEMTKGILRRHVHDAKEYVHNIINSRNLLTVPA